MSGRQRKRTSLLDTQASFKLKSPLPKLSAITSSSSTTRRFRSKMVALGRPNTSLLPLGQIMQEYKRTKIVPQILKIKAAIPLIYWFLNHPPPRKTAWWCDFLKPQEDFRLLSYLMLGPIFHVMCFSWLVMVRATKIQFWASKKSRIRLVQTKNTQKVLSIVQISYSYMDHAMRPQTCRNMWRQRTSFCHM